MKRVLSLLLSLTMTASLFMVTPVQAVEKQPAAEKYTATDYRKFTDVSGHWAGSYLKWAVNNRVMVGVTTTKMRPDANITRAQMATMITSAFGATQEADISTFIDVPKDAWFHGAIAKAVQMGFLETFGNSVSPNQAVTREEVAVSLVKAAGYVVGANSSYVNKFTDAGKINTNYAKYFATAVQQGLLSGYGDGRVGPKDKVTRAQFATILYRVANAYMNQTMTYNSKNVEGSLMVGVGNVRLSGMKVTKNLFLSDGVGTGEVQLDNTNVGGVVYVRGTGPNTLYLKNNTRVAGIVFCNPNNAVHLVVDESSSAGWVNIHESKDSVTLEGNVGDVTVDTGKAPVALVGAKVDDLNITGRLAAVKADKASTINDIVLFDIAAGAVLETNGRVGSLKLNASDADVTINGSLESLEFGSSATGAKFKTGKDADMNNVALNAKGLDITLDGKMKNVDIGSNNSKFKFAKDTDANRIDIDGNDVEFTLDGTVKRIYTTGDDLELTGDGTVSDKITITDGDDIRISIPNATVYNKGGKNVYVGKVRVRTGETVTVNASGTGTVADDIANGRDPSDTGNSHKPGTSKGDKVYTLTFVANGGTCKTTTLRTDDNGSVPLLPTPTRRGYEFLGWFTSTSGGSMITQGVAVDRNTTLYAQWKRIASEPDSGEGSNPGGSGGSSNPSTPATELVYNVPSSAQPSDFGFDSKYTLSSFGTSMFADSYKGKLTGTVKYLEDFLGYKGYASLQTGYYMPLVISPNFVTGSGELTIGERTLTDSDMKSQGTTYNGQMIFFVPLDPAASAGNQKVKFTYDPDGARTTYKPVEVTLDYSEVTFAGGNTDEQLYSKVTAIPGIDGAETATIDAQTTGLMSFKYTLHTKALLETAYGGRYGYWTGLRIPAYKDVAYLHVKQVDPTGAQSENTMYAQTDDKTGEKYVNWTINAANKALGKGDFKGVYRLELVWYDSSNRPSAHKSAKIVVNLVDCKLAGEATDPAIPEGAQSVAENLATELMTKEEALEKFGVDIDDLGLNLRITQNTLGGTLIPYQNVEKGYDGFYIPLKITGKAKANVKLERDKGATVASSETKAETDGSFTVYAMFKMVPSGNSVRDTRIEVVPETPSQKWKAASIVLHCDAAMAVKDSLVASSDIPTGTVCGIAVNDAVTDLKVRVFYNTVDLDGTVKKISKANVSGVEYSDVWVVPLQVLVNTELKNYTIETRGAGITSFHKIMADEVTGKLVNVLVPLAKGQESRNSATISLKDADGKEVSTVMVYATPDCKLDGYVAPPKPEPGESTRTLTDLILDTAAVKKEYKVGDKFDPTGLKVTAEYSTNEGPIREEVKTGWTTNYDEASNQGTGAMTYKSFDAAGTKTITVSFKDGGVTKTATFEVTVT